MRMLRSLVVDMDALGMLGRWTGTAYEATDRSAPAGCFWVSKVKKTAALKGYKRVLRLEEALRL